MNSIFRDKDLIIELIRTSFKLRYNNSILGILWVLIKPFLNFVVLYFVWTNIFGAKEDFFAVNLMLGIIIWTFLQEGVIFGMNGLLERANIMLKINFPRYTAIIAATFMAFINLTINFALFLVIFVIYNLNKYNSIFIPDPNFNLISYGINIFFILFAAATLYTLILGISFFLSVVLVRLRDMQHIIELFFVITYWLTPIVYSQKWLSDQLALNGPNLFIDTILNNPVGWVITFMRSVLVYGNYSNWFTVFQVMIASVIITYLGYLYYSSKIKAIAEYF